MYTVDRRHRRRRCAGPAPAAPTAPARGADVGRKRRSKSPRRVDGAHDGVELDRLEPEAALALRSRGRRRPRRTAGSRLTSSGSRLSLWASFARHLAAAHAEEVVLDVGAGKPVSRGMVAAPWRDLRSARTWRPTTLRTTVRPERGGRVGHHRTAGRDRAGADRGRSRPASTVRASKPSWARSSPSPTSRGGAWVSTTSTRRPSRRRRHQAAGGQAAGPAGVAGAACTGSGRRRSARDPPRPASRRPPTSTTWPSAFTAPGGHGGSSGRPARITSPLRPSR